MVATEAWELELGVAGVEEEASVEEKDGSVPLYKGCKYQTSPLEPQKLACFQGIVPKRRLGYPRSGRHESLKKGRHDLRLDKIHQ